MTGFSVLWEGAMPIFHQEPNLSAAWKEEPKVFYIIICIKNQFFFKWRNYIKVILNQTQGTTNNKKKQLHDLK